MPVEPCLYVQLLVHEMASKTIVDSVLVIYRRLLYPCLCHYYMIKPLVNDDV